MTAESQVEELKPNIARLQALGCQLVELKDLGTFGYIATFQKKDLMFSVVKDRGYWHLAGETEELQRFPGRKSRGLVEKDAIAWLEKKTPNQPPEPRRCAPGSP